MRVYRQIGKPNSYLQGLGSGKSENEIVNVDNVEVTLNLLINDNEYKSMQKFSSLFVRSMSRTLDQYKYTNQNTSQIIPGSSFQNTSFFTLMENEVMKDGEGIYSALSTVPYIRKIENANMYNTKTKRLTGMIQRDGIVRSAGINVACNPTGDQYRSLSMETRGIEIDKVDILDGAWNYRNVYYFPNKCFYVFYQGIKKIPFDHETFEWGEVESITDSFPAEDSGYIACTNLKNLVFRQDTQTTIQVFDMETESISTINLSSPIRSVGNHGWDDNVGAIRILNQPLVNNVRVNGALISLTGSVVINSGWLFSSNGSGFVKDNYIYHESTLSLNNIVPNERADEVMIGYNGGFSLNPFEVWVLNDENMVWRFSTGNTSTTINIGKICSFQDLIGDFGQEIPVNEGDTFEFYYEYKFLEGV